MQDLPEGVAENDFIANAQLKNSTDPFAALVRTTRMPMVITNPRLPDNPIVFANDAFCRLTGYWRDEILGRNCRFLQGPDTDPEALQEIRDAIRHARSIRIDLKNYRKTGEAFWNRLLLGPVHNAAGEVAYFFASQVDATLAQADMRSLTNSNAALAAELADRVREVEIGEARLTAATEAGGLGIWHLDLASDALFTSATFKRNFGREESQSFTYQDFLGAVHPADIAQVRAAFARSMQTGQDLQIEHRVERPDHRLAWVRITGRMERDAKGHAISLVGTLQDNTEAMLAKRRTALLEALDRDVYAVTLDPREIAYRSAEALGRTLEVSRAGYGLIDTSTETITIERDWNAAGIKTLAGTLQFRDYGSYIEELLRSETVVVPDARMDARTHDHADALVAVNAQSFINMPVSESGGLVALFFVNHATAREWSPDEISLMREVAHRTRQAVERRRAEHDLLTLADSLERKVLERTEELMKAEAALRQSQKMEAVGQLTGGLAHDFNNLLGAIAGSFELLRRKAPDTAGLARYVEIGHTATKRAAALTHRLLAFSRQQTLEPKVIQVNQLIGGFEELVRRTIGPQVELEVVAGIGVWSVQTDPGQLENALLNLCINARDAMPEGGKLVIETANRGLDERSASEHEMLPGQYVSISVSDNGSGMPADVIARAFDPFYTTKPLGLGTGLGLSMVYGFARQSGGQARIYSEIGIGTRVHMYLPRYAGPEAASIDDSIQAETFEKSDEGETILVVDDEAAVRLLMVETLEDLGYRVLEAGDGPDALKILKDHPCIKLLVTDVGLPGGMNGRHVADVARVIDPSLRVLFVTGYAENAVLSHGLLPAGMQVLTKPFELSAFGLKVQMLLKSEKS